MVFPDDAENWISGPATLVFESQGHDFEIEARENATFLVLRGQPLDEPIASYGPFVMNSADEIQSAIADFRSGKMGQLEALSD